MPNKDLENFRKSSIEELKKRGFFLKEEIEEVLNIFINSIYIIGSAINSRKFTENSDIDLAVEIISPRYPVGIVQNLTSLLHDENNKGNPNFSFSFGFPDWIVINMDKIRGIKIA